MRFLFVLLLSTTTTATVAAAQWPVGNQGVPASFDCAMRKAAYAFGQKLMPRHGAFEALYYALNLNAEDCKADFKDSQSATVTATQRSRQLQQLPDKAVYVSLEGKDPVDISTAATPTMSTPFRSIHLALEYAKQN